MSQFKTLTLTVLTVLLAVTSVNADSDYGSKKPWVFGGGLGPNFSKVDAVNDELKSSFGATLWLQRDFEDDYRMDLAADYFDLEGASRDYAGLSLGYGMRFFEGDYMSPFAMIGVGVGKAQNFPRAIDTNQSTYHVFLRGGLEDIYSLGNFKLGFLIDYLQVEMDGNSARRARLSLPMLSLTYRFGGEKEPVQAMTKTPEPAPAPLDSDQDGVVDGIDECPGTPLGKKVNSIGCEPVQVVKKELRIEFEINKAEIKEEFLPVVKEFAEYLKAQSDLQVIIEGHTDSMGSKEWNRTLSQLRAEAVREKLVKDYGVAEGRITSIGYGPDRPEKPNNTKANRQKNRRVLAVLK